MIDALIGSGIQIITIRWISKGLLFFKSPSGEANGRAGRAEHD